MKLKFPHPILILLGFIFLSAGATYIIPSGEFDRELDEATGREVVIPGSFHSVKDQNANLYDIFLSIPEGFIEGADIIVLILLVGGCFYVIEKTGALQSGISALLVGLKLSNKVLLFALALFFGLCGATIAMQEEIIALTPLLVLIASKTNYDKRALIAIALGSALIGGSFSPINIFGSLLAINVAELDPGEGFAFRIVFLCIAILLWAAYHIFSGGLKSNPENESAYELEPLTTRHKIILALTLIGIIVAGWGIVANDWGFNEMSAFFFVLGIICGLVGKMGPNGVSRAYAEGFGELIFAGMIVGLARSVYLVLQDAVIIDSIIQALFQPLEGLPAPLAATGMMLGQSLIHVPVSSTSGQAILTIPLAAPLTDLIGLSRQVAVFTYQYGAGLVDILSPTNGGMMAIIAAAGIPYNRWFQYIIKPFIMIYILGLAISIISVYIF